MFDLSRSPSKCDDCISPMPTYTGLIFRKLIAAAGISLLMSPASAMGSSATSPLAPKIIEFKLPLHSAPHGISAQSSGNKSYVWITEPGINKIGRILVPRQSPKAPLRQVTEFSLPTPNSRPFGISAHYGIWFTEARGNRVGLLRRSGQIEEWTLPTPKSLPWGIYSDYGRGVWFTEAASNKIATFGANGIIEYSIPISASYPTGLTIAKNGRKWFVESLGNRVAATGAYLASGLEINEMGGLTGHSRPMGITKGPDGNIWLTEASANRIAKVTADGDVVEYPIPTPHSEPMEIVSGPGGHLWFTERHGNRIGRIDERGHVAEFSIPTRASRPEGITFSHPDGNLWFTESRSGKVGRIGTGLSQISIGRIGFRDGDAVVHLNCLSEWRCNGTLRLRVRIGGKRVWSKLVGLMGYTRAGGSRWAVTVPLRHKAFATLARGHTRLTMLATATLWGGNSASRRFVFRPR